MKNSAISFTNDNQAFFKDFNLSFNGVYLTVANINVNYTSFLFPYVSRKLAVDSSQQAM